MPKVLLADDSTHAQRMGSKILAGEGIEVITVNNGEAAVKKLAAGSFDLVLADIFMPGRSGYELCSYIKNSPKLALTPVVLIVGLLEPYDAEQGKSVGADAVLRKPFETTVVVETVQRLMEAARQRRAAMAPPSHEKTQILTPPVTGAEQALPEMQVAAPAAPAPVAIPPEMQDFAMELGEQPAALQTEPVPPVLELEHLVVEPESGSERAIFDLPPVAAEQPLGAVVAPPAVSPATQPIENAAPFDFAELQMTAAEAAEPVAFELPQERAEAPDFEALPASPAEEGAAPRFIPPSGTAEQEGGSIDFTAQLQSMAAAAGAGAVPEAELSAAVAAPPVAAPPAQIEVEPAEAAAPLETPAPPAPVQAAPPEPQGRPQWIIEPQPTAESDLGAFAEAAIAPAIEAAQAAVAPSPAAEAAAAAEVAAVELEFLEETPLAAAPEPATLVEEAPPSLEAAAPEPAAPEAAILAEPAVPREPQEEGPPETAEEAAAREEADKEVRAFEMRQPAAGVLTAESAPPTPTAGEIDQAVAHAAEPPAAPHPAAAEVPDWAELLKTVEQTPAPEVRQPVEAAAEPAAPPSPAAAVLPAAELRAAIETGLNSALPGITAVPGLLDTIMREVLRRFGGL